MLDELQRRNYAQNTVRAYSDLLVTQNLHAQQCWGHHAVASAALAARTARKARYEKGTPPRYIEAQDIASLRDLQFVFTNSPRAAEWLG